MEAISLAPRAHNRDIPKQLENLEVEGRGQGLLFLWSFSSS